MMNSSLTENIIVFRGNKALDFSKMYPPDPKTVKRVDTG